MASNEVIHSGDRSWWDGSLKTLCGLKLPKQQIKGRVWVNLRGVERCPTCERLNK